MSNAYIYIFTPKNFDRGDVAKYLDTVAGVENWFFSMPNSVFIIGTVPARQLSKLLVDRFGEHRHFITIVSKKARAGWIPKEHWDFLTTDDA